MKPRLFESLMQGQTRKGSIREAYEELKRKMDVNPFLKRYTELGVKEGFFSDSAYALGRMHDTVVEAAWPEMIGRNIINVKLTSEALERFPLDGGAVAYVYAEGGAVRLSGKKTTTVDISTNILVESGDDWTKEFSEDATWNVMDLIVQNVGRAVGLKETQKILALYAGIAAGDLATGGELAGGGAVLSWTQLLNLRYAVRSGNWRPNRLAISEMQAHQLLNDDKFVKSVYLPSSATDIEQGIIGTVLGMQVQVSTEVPNGTAYATDTRVGSVMLVRRDLTVEDWYDAKTGKSGVRGTTRIGLGVLRANAVARMTNIKTTLT
jgi:HK97 family phage major capsid protein